MTTAYDSRAAALHRHLDTQIENLERKNYHKGRRSKKEQQSRYKNIQLDLFTKKGKS